MARHEEDKEDLMTEATALVDRAEYRRREDVPGIAHSDVRWYMVTIGFRKDGSCSVYFDQNPFYQFDHEGRLRRAHWNGLLYRSQTNTLACLERSRSSEATTLLRRDLSPNELQDFRDHMRNMIEDLQNLFHGKSLVCARIVSESPDLSDRICAFLQIVLEHSDQFLSSSIRGRK